MLTCCIVFAALRRLTSMSFSFTASTARNAWLVIKRCQHCRLKAAPFSLSTCGRSGAEGRHGTTLKAAKKSSGSITKLKPKSHVRTRGRGVGTTHARTFISRRTRLAGWQIRSTKQPKSMSYQFAAYICEQLAFTVYGVYGMHCCAVTPTKT